LVYEAKNDARNADLYFQRALLIGEKALGAEHLEITEVLAEYEIFLRATGRITEAKRISAKLHDLKEHALKEQASTPNH
jgi:hypothetical protein